MITEERVLERKVKIDQKVAIITDSIAQLPRNLTDEFDISVIPLNVNFDGRSFQDGIDLNLSELYRRMKDDMIIPTTSVASLGFLEENYRCLLNAGAESILFISLSGKLSSSYNMAVAAAKSVKNEFPDREIVVMDSQRVSFAEGSVVLAAACTASEGKPMAEVVETARKAIPRCGLVGALSTLEYVIRGGRLGELSYLLNSIIDVMPVVAVNGKGTVSFVSITRSDKQAMSAMINYVEKKVKGKGDLHLAVLHAAAEKVADRFEKMVKEKLEPVEVTRIEFTPVMGAHAGPGFFGLSYYYE